MISSAGSTAIHFQGATFYRNNPRTAPKASILPAGNVTAFPSCFYALWPPGRQPSDGEEIVPAVNKALMAEERQQTTGGSDPYKQALFLYEKGLFAEAVEKLTPFAFERSQAGGAAALLSRIFANQGKLSEAMSFCERAISAERVDPGHYYLRATILQEQGNSKTPPPILGRPSTWIRTSCHAHLLLGNLALHRGKREESVRHFRNAFELLRQRLPGEVVPGAEGLTAGRLMEIIRSTGFEDVA